MTKMGFNGSREYDHIVKIDQGKLPTDSCKNHVHRTLKRGRGILYTEGNSQKSMQTKVGRKGGQASGPWVHFDLPVAGVRIQRRKYRRIA